MQTTKGHILTLLMRHGRGTVDLLVEQPTLAPMTVRQHLAALGRDGLVLTREARRPKGRPHFVYHLTEKGEETFPKRYDRLAARVLSELGCVDALGLTSQTTAQCTTFFTQRTADRVVAEHVRRLNGRSLNESGFAEWSRGGDGYEVRDYNCNYRRLVADRPGCIWHRRVIGQLVGAPVRWTSPTSRGERCCRFPIVAPGRHELPQRNQE